MIVIGGEENRKGVCYTNVKMKPDNKNNVGKYAEDAYEKNINCGGRLESE